MLLEGIFPAMTTPFYPDGKVYFRKLEHNVDRFSRTPIAGLVVLGSNGEAIMLSDAEQRDVLKVAREFAAPEKVLIAGAGCESANNTLSLTEHAATLGYDVALVRTPYYFRSQMTTLNWVAFYNYIADRSPIPIMMYSVKVFTDYDLPVEAIVELAGHPNILGIKDTGVDFEKIRQILAGTKSVRRAVNVTEVFRAVTGRMLQANTAGEGELLSVAALSNHGSSSSKESSESKESSGTNMTTATAVARPRFKMRQK